MPEGLAMSTTMSLPNFHSYPVYKPQPLRPLDEIRADILALEQETEGLLAEVIGSGPV